MVDDRAGRPAPLDELLVRGQDPHRPSLENRVAYEWEAGLDTLGYRNRTLRDQVTLGWARHHLAGGRRPATVVDVGCSRGNYLLMLAAQLGHDPGIAYVGYDIDDRAVAFGQAFASEVAGYGTCRFEHRPIEDGLPHGDGEVDVAVANDVLEHLPDVGAALRELRRVVGDHGTVIISTPLEDSWFKRAAERLDRLSGGRLYRAYYRGKDADLDADGRPVMAVHAGHDHISEMGHAELGEVIAAAGLRIAEQRLMPIVSGSRWFDEHPLLLSTLLAAEAVHQRLQRPGWAHGACLRLVPAR